MIFFYEGLPRSGKSLSALKEYVVPMLKKGRKVFAYIEGLNHQKIAELAGISLDECERLLIALTREQVPHWFEIVEENSFVVLDEAQNFWPNQRTPLQPEVVASITEHGHRGLDILLMGQVFAKVNTQWTLLCAQRVHFLKREAAGKPNEFTQTIFKPVMHGDKVKWEEIRKFKGQPYDIAYFGAYKSHTDETDNKETLIDDRANVWNSPIIRKWLPLTGAVMVFAIYYLYHSFMGGGLLAGIDKNGSTKLQSSQSVPFTQAPVTNVPVVANTGPAQVKPVQNSNKAVQSVAIIDEKPMFVEPDDNIDALSRVSRIRLGGFARMGSQLNGFIEWRSESFQVVDRMDFNALKLQGWMVMISQDGNLAMVVKGTKRYVATMWPLVDEIGRVPDATNTKIKNEAIAPHVSS